MKKLLSDIKACDLCSAHLPHGVRPVVQLHPACRILIISQAPGRKVHESGIPFNDKSGEVLRGWLNISKEVFYDAEQVGILPMGFCYPGKAPSGDRPPRPECAAHWHQRIFPALKNLRLIILVGSYAQKYYLGKNADLTATDTVKKFAAYLPTYFPIIHPSPRNNIWLKKNPWFVTEVVPELQKIVRKALH